jgi:hypothetical protein
MGVLASGSAHTRPPARPSIDTSGLTFKHLPQPLRSHIRSFGALGQLLIIPPLSPQIYNSAGVGRGGGVPEFLGSWSSSSFCSKEPIQKGGPQLFWIGILIFMLLRSPCKNLEPYDNPFWGFV